MCVFPLAACNKDVDTIHRDMCHEQSNMFMCCFWPQQFYSNLSINTSIIICVCMLFYIILLSGCFCEFFTTGDN